MKKLINRYWIISSIILCVLFIAVFLPLSTRSVGFARALSHTLTGVAIIWIIYFVRINLFRHPSPGGSGEGMEVEDKEKQER